jgi:4-hydroxybenzoate polyprenyltransferase
LIKISHFTMTFAAQANSPVPTTLAGRIRVFAGDIKLQHSIFALPWALLSAVLAGKIYPGSLTLGHIALIVACMVFARTFAMTANRLIDAELDAKNPRTARRALPSGALSRRFMRITLGVTAAGFVLATAGFQWLFENPWPVVLAAPVLGFLLGYPWMKRFTRLCHYYLGVALALAPVCAWIAIAGRLDWAPICMFGIVLTWTAGFDIIYACQDYENDLATGVVSVPSKLGVARALWVSRLTHGVSAALLIVLGIFTPQFGVLYFAAAGIAILLLVIEQSLVKPTDLSKVNLSFFTVNGAISLLVGALGILDLLK